jgi:uncharacterized protein (DUF111 family)
MGIIQDAYKQKMAVQLKQWSAQINLLEAKVKNARADMKIKRADELHQLRVKQRAAFGKMRELGKANGEAWEQVKEAADKIWRDLKTGVVAAHYKFK